ncbi:MAG: MoxR family ATPase [Candidatus Cloacimonadales bacterium]
MSSSNVELIDKLKGVRLEILNELKKVIVGQDDVLEKILIALFANGHILLEGVPGLAKTLLISSLSKALNLKFSRIQFTPDLMPSDITGTDILSENKSDGKRYFEYIQGPIFANIILADEINRTPPKTQAALLQAMQEYEITNGNQTYKLDQPFIVLATQNPIEQEGTYPLPEAQLDRFMFNIIIDYPSYAEEIEIVKVTTKAQTSQIKPVISGKDIIAIQRAILDIPVSEHVFEYAVKLVRKTRPNLEDSDPETSDLISWGAGPRASQYLVLAAKSRAALQGRLTPSEDDVKFVAPLVLRHRVLPSFKAEAEGIKSTDIINKLLK